MLENHNIENALVDHNGVVYWIPTMIARTTCTIDITYFPWDVQVIISVKLFLPIQLFIKTRIVVK